MRIRSELIARLPAIAGVLDLGCGAGVPATKQLAKRFAVTGVDIFEQQLRLARDQQSTSRRITYTVTAGTTTTTITTTTPAPVTTTPPRGTHPSQVLRISVLRQSHSAWAEVSTHIKRRPTSTTFSFKLNLRRASRCASRACGKASWSGTGATRTAGNAQHRGCSYSKAAGTLSHSGHAGLNQIHFTGRGFTGTRQLCAGYHRTRSRWAHFQDEAAAVTILAPVKRSRLAPRPAVDARLSGLS